MKNKLLILCCTLTLQLSAQTTTAETLVTELEQFMDSHIPYMHMSVIGYTLTYENGTLTKETLLDDGRSHSKVFQMKNADITADKEKIKGEEAEMYGFRTYWDIEINNDWIISELGDKKDKDYVVKLLERIVEQTK